MSSKKHSDAKRRSRAAAPQSKRLSKGRFARTLNLRLLVTSCVVFAVLGAGLFMLRGYRQQQLVSLLAQRSDRLAEDGELRKAEFYLQKYLTLHPDDFEARLKLIGYAEQLVKQGAGRERLIRLLAETVGLPAADAQEERSRLRVMLAEQLLLNEQYNAALEQIKPLETEGRLAPDAVRVKALASLGLVPARGSLLESTRRTRLSELLPLLEDASDHAPGDATLALAIAQIYREYPSLTADSERLANDRVNRMVAARSGEPDAFVARYRYRRRYDIAGDVDDLKAALALDPGHYETNLLLGMETLQGDRVEGDGSIESVGAAADFFRAAIDSRPGSAEAYYLLARLQWNHGDKSDAIDLLRDADRVVSNGSIDLRFLLTDYVLSEGDLDEASRLVASLQEAIHSPNTGMTADGIALMNSRLRLLEARLSASRGDISAALAYYSSVANSEGQTQREAATGALSREAEQEMAKLLVGLGRWDQVAQQLTQLANQLEVEMSQDPQRNKGGGRPIATPVSLESEYRAARIKAAEAYLRAGQYANAVQQLEVISGQADVGEKTLPREALETRLLTELSIQLDALPADRSWEEFRFLAERARKELPKSERVALASIHFQVAQVHDGIAAKKEVQAEIERVIEKFPASPNVWWIVANAYLDLGDTRNSEAALDKYLALESVEELRISRRVAFLADSGRVSEAREWVAAQLSEADEAVRPLFRRLEVRILRSEEQGEHALRKAKALVGEVSDKDSLVLAWGIAVDQGDWGLAEDIERRLAQASLVAHDELDFYRAQRMLASFRHLSSDQQDELLRVVSRIRSERPNWHRAAEMEARLAEARGDEEAALKAYERAVALGDRSTSTLEHLTLLLFRNGEYGQAQQVIDRLRSTSGIISRNTESLAINTALKQKRLSDAKTLALESVAEHPEDPARKLWLHHVLLLNGEGGEAEIVLSEAAEKFPDSEILWKAHLAYLAKNERHEEALVLLGELPSSLQRDPLGRSLALAQGYEMLGQLTRARTFYQEALDVSPRDIGARLQYANLLLKSDAVTAREQFEKVLRAQPDNVEARRKLAALLAATGEPSVWQRIDDLLDTTQGSSGQLDKRLRAILLTKRGKTSKERADYCELARRILLGIIENSSYAAEDIDRLLLAGVYEQEGTLNSDATFFELARSQLRYLRSRADGDERYGALYLGFLLRSIDVMAMMDDDGSVRTAFIRDARGVLEQRERDLTNSDVSNPLDQLSLLGIRARLLKSEGRMDEAQIALKEFASQQVADEQDQAVRARLALGLGAIYSLLGAHAEAEPWYRQLMRTAPGAELLVSKSLFQQGKPEDAVGVFLRDSESVLSPEKAATLAGLLSASESDSNAFEKAWPAVSGTLEKHAEDVQLLISVAVLEVTRGNQRDAISLFRRVLEIEPDHTLALNNLATLLGETEGDRPEALRLIRHAIRVAGRSPALLDTQGTILLQSGNSEDAISSLEESVASVNVDPRYYFHLAAAYLRGGESGKALDALEEARRRGLDKTVMTTSDRELMKELEAGLGIAKSSQRSAA